MTWRRTLSARLRRFTPLSGALFFRTLNVFCLMLMLGWCVPHMGRHVDVERLNQVCDKYMQTEPFKIQQIISDDWCQWRMSNVRIEPSLQKSETPAAQYGSCLFPIRDLFTVGCERLFQLQTRWIWRRSTFAAIVHQVHLRIQKERVCLACAWDDRVDQQTLGSHALYVWVYHEALEKFAFPNHHFFSLNRRS